MTTNEVDGEVDGKITRPVARRVEDQLPAERAIRAQLTAVPLTPLR
jgi:hypothetical protein